jgi:hypothetical protein
MAVGMVVEQPFAEPEQPLDAEVPAQPLLDLLAGQARVAVGIEQALLGADGEAGAVDVDRAALEDPVEAQRIEIGRLRQPKADRVVALELIFAAPAVEPEASRRPLPPVLDDDRAGVAQPDVAERLLDDGRERRQLGGCAGGSGIGGDQAHLLPSVVRMDRLGKSGHLPPRRLEVSLPEVGMTWEADPHPFMLGPFGWLADTSVWIDYFRKRLSGLERRLDRAEIMMHPFVSRIYRRPGGNSSPVATFQFGHGRGVGYVDVVIAVRLQLAADRRRHG